MEIGRHYKVAPIVEAILQFQTVTPDDLGVEELATLQVGAGFDHEPLYHMVSQFAVDGTEVRADTHRSQVGYGYRRADGSVSIQALTDRFGYVQSGRYSDWISFCGEAERAWLEYRRAARPSAVQQISARFINQIWLPLKIVEISDYLRVQVPIPPQLPQVINGFQAQVELPLLDLGVDVTITVNTLGSSSDRPGGGLGLDIDVRAPVARHTEDDGFDDAVTGTLDRIRYAKNLVFEACITDATRSLID